MRVMVGGRTCSTDDSSPSVSGPMRSMLESAASCDGVTPALACWRSRRASRMTTRRSRAATTRSSSAETSVDGAMVDMCLA